MEAQTNHGVLKYFSGKNHISDQFNMHLTINPLPRCLPFHSCITLSVLITVQGCSLNKKTAPQNGELPSLCTMQNAVGDFGHSHFNILVFNANLSVKSTEKLQQHPRGNTDNEKRTELAC